MPKVIGAWLAGLYDNDKLVLKAARDSFIRVFTTDEKRKNVWKVYQSSILEFVEDAVLQQTSLTLSDERTVNPDEAESKHARVVATATLVLNKLLGQSLIELPLNSHNEEAYVALPHRHFLLERH